MCFSASYVSLFKHPSSDIRLIVLGVSSRDYLFNTRHVRDRILWVREVYFMLS